MDQQQTQHGHGVQPDRVETVCRLRRHVLQVRRLQLGLEPAERVQQLSEPRIPSVRPQSPSGVPHWRMVYKIIFFFNYSVF